MFVSTALAQATTAAAPAPAPFMGMLPLVLIFGVFYFLLIRPQQKKLKLHQGMLNDLKKGDKIVTAGGIIAVVEGMDGAEVSARIADGVVVKIQKNTIATVLNKIPANDVLPPKKAVKSARTTKITSNTPS
jgi:preprotein translocase subunit YajC